MSINKKHWRLALIVMIVGLLAFGAMAFAGAGGYPTNCEGPLVDPITGDDVKPLIQTSQENPAFPDPNPALLDSPDECELKYFKLEIDDGDITNSQEFTAPDGLSITIYKGTDDDNDTVFAFDSNYPIFHVFAKGGPDEGNLYSYYPTYPNGVYNDCGLKQSDQGGWSHIGVYYCVPQYGCLEITKNFTGYPNHEDFELPAVTVDVTGPYGYDETFVLDEDNDWYVEICDLRTGAYTVTEREVEGWTTSYSAGPEVTVAANDTASVVIDNELDLGCLEITKTFTGYPDHEDFELPTVTVDVTGPYGYDETFVLDEDNDWNVEICELYPGEYTVTERDVPGWTTSYAVGPTVTVEANETAEVEIENELDKGCLRITKEWVYPDSEDLDGPYFPVPNYIEVQITGPYGYDETFVLNESNGWSRTIRDLVPGYYTAEELGEIEGYVTVYDPDPPTVEVLADAEEAIEILIINYALFGDDTIWAYSAYAYDELEKRGEEVPSVVYHNNKVDGNNSNAWGWTNFINDVGTYDFYLFAGAGQNDTERGTNVGTLTVEVERCDEEDAYFATVNYNVSASILAEYHLWVGDTPLPLVRRGNRWVPTAAPGQFPYGDGAVVQVCLEEGFYVAAHGVVRMPYTPDL